MRFLTEVFGKLKRGNQEVQPQSSAAAGFPPPSQPEAIFRTPPAPEAPNPEFIATTPKAGMVTESMGPLQTPESTTSVPNLTSPGPEPIMPGSTVTNRSEPIAMPTIAPTPEPVIMPRPNPVETLNPRPPIARTQQSSVFEPPSAPLPPKEPLMAASNVAKSETAMPPSQFQPRAIETESATSGTSSTVPLDKAS